MREYYTDSMTYVRPEPCHKLALQHGAVTLQQRGKDNFAVRYGKQVRADLTYEQAATAYGGALMHQAACDGLLDNRERNER